MRRASRVYLTCANVGKITRLRLFLLLYVNVVNYFIERFWSMKDFSSALADKVITGRAVNRFKIKARLAQCAAKQAKEIVRSQKDRKVKTMPLLRRKVATLDNRFISIVSQIIVPLGICFVVRQTSKLDPIDIWIAILLGHATRCALSVIRFRQGKWRNITVDIEQKAMNGAS